MTKVFDDALLDQAARDAERALAARDPDTLAGRFSPRSSKPPPEQKPQVAPAMGKRRTA